MLDYVKLILDKVSFDVNLFQKELIKSLKWLTDTEKNELEKWAENNYGNKYGYVLQDVFKEK
ncbi:MAG: hypothetical protein CVU05_16275 [Bacteroidetes bacterium HGW-Bacteroidetes-21]|nr:MAG: hypothetical protein CVU05_16275 [Bacteroidetes bacterium HGW-Bacteroidetes-21]